jgi:hypothetical protein
LFNGGGGDVCGGFCDESCERVCDDHPADPVPEMRDDRDECPFYPFYPFYRCDVYDDRLLVLLLMLVVVLVRLPFYILNKEINFF